MAIVPSTGLGDGIIQLVLAQNLARLGLNVDYYHTFLADINELVAGLSIYKPVSRIIEKKIDYYDIFLQDYGSKKTDLSDYLDRIESRLAVYSMSRNRPGKTLANPKFKPPPLVIDGKIIDLGVFNGRSLRPDNSPGLSTAGCIVEFLKYNRLIDEPDYQLSLRLPQSWQQGKYKDRILIHPTSGNEKKNWLPKRFIRLAGKLNDAGYRPVFIVAPFEKEHWETEINGEFGLTAFNNFIDLAKYYYESALHIGTDSGNGHFASALELPTVTIINRRSIPFTWRPNWAQNITVGPVFSKKLVGHHYWKYTVSENQILASVDKLLLT